EACGAGGGVDRGVARSAQRGDRDAQGWREPAHEGGAAMTADDPKTRALKMGERPLVRHAERYRLSVTAGAQAGQSITGAGEILRVGSKEGNSLRLNNETVSRYH